MEDDKRTDDQTMAVQENWEDLLHSDESEAETKKKSSPKKKPDSNVKQEKASSSSALPSSPCAEPSSSSEKYVSLNDPLQEKLRRQKIVEEADEALLDDLFSGCAKPARPITEALPGKTVVSETTSELSQPVTNMTAALKDPLQLFDFKSLCGVENFARKLGPKISKSTAKSPAWLRLLDLLLQDCAPKMDEKDLKTLQKKVREAIKEKADAKRESIIAKKKPNESLAQMKNYEDELDMFYGDEEEAEAEGEEEEEDYYADFM